MTDIDRSRRRVLASLTATVAVTACGGGGGDGGSPPPGPPPPAGSGRIVTASSQGYTVYDVASRVATVYPLKPGDADTGISASPAGLVGVTWGYNVNGDPWTMGLISAADGSTVASYGTPPSLAFSLPLSATAVSADGNWMAIGVAVQTNSGYVDRVMYFNRGALQLGYIDPGEEVVWVGSSTMLVRSGTRLTLYDTQGAAQGTLPVTCNDRRSSYSVSRDGRYVVYEDALGQIRALDRDTGQDWLAATSTLTMYAPVLAPDDRRLAMLRGTLTVGLFVHAVPFAAGRTETVASGTSLTTANDGQAVLGDERIAWI